MAEIRVERVRKGGLGWLWALLVVLLLAAAAWYLWANGYFGTRPAAVPDTARTSLNTGRAITTTMRPANLSLPSRAA
jgi:hypothetical protein